MTAALALLFTASGCSHDADRDSVEPRDSASRQATCRLEGKQTAQVTLTDDGQKLTLEFVGQPVPPDGEAGYFAMVYDEAGETGAQLGMTFNDGEPEGYLVFDTGAAQQTNLEGVPDVNGDSVTGTFPLSAGPLRDFEVAQWNATFTRNLVDVGTCLGDPDEFLQPFPD